jgi:hypothetical protein
MTVRLQLILLSKITGAVLFRIFGGFLHVPTTQIYCLTGAIISETHKIIITIHNKTRSSTVLVFSFRRKRKRMEVLMRAPGSQFPMWGGAGPRFSEVGPRSVYSFQGPDSARPVRGQYTAFRVQIQQG